MQEKQRSKLIYPILGSIIGMALGFTTFILTEQIIFLITFVTIGLSLGIALSQKQQLE